jgi:hypothetical protein
VVSLRLVIGIDSSGYRFEVSLNEADLCKLRETLSVS